MFEKLDDKPGLRGAVYALGVAVLGVLGALGVIDAVQAQEWAGLIDNALELVFALVLALAKRNTPQGQA